MSSIRATFLDKQMGAKFKLLQKKNAGQIHTASAQTAKQSATEIQTRGRKNIRGAGNFKSPRWQEGFRSIPRLKGRDFTIITSSIVPYFNIFEFGGIIHGKPLLWIPLSFAFDAFKIRARDFPGGLFRVDRKTGGAPLLLSIKTGEPKYFGKESVKIPKKFSIRVICKAVVKKMSTYFKRNMKRGR